MLAALTALASVPMAGLAATRCGFEGAGGARPIVLGPLDPSRPVGITATQSIRLIGNCSSLSVAIAGGNAQVLTGPGAAVLSYRANAVLDSSSGQGGRSVTLNVRVPGGASANLPAGRYSGALTLLLLP